ncbi:ATP-binding protein [Legionella sp. 27cVA30]|uniref:ATP-binding protein n=1 Tax=Legionella TaxID=445 RepID=UPI000F8C35F3|nr:MULTISPECIES: ATP-binding protein [Legionella]MCP0913307.1 ATP-binding protein [Legionella sp. 27cVA30]RUR14665.1 response regulator [Legionella septentrionalis]
MDKPKTVKSTPKTDTASLEKTINELKIKIAEQESKITQLTNLINILPGDIYWKDVEGIWAGVNKRCVQSLYRMGFIKKGIESEVLGKTDYQLFDPKTAHAYRQNDLEVMEKKIELTREETTQLPTGEKIILLSTKRPFQDKEGKVVGVVGNTIDISYLKKIEAELKEATKKAEASSLAKTEFLENMSHDIRTPLCGVIGMADLLLEKALNEEQKQYAEWIHDCSEQLLTLLNSILDIVSLGNAREDEVKETTFDLYQFIEELVRLEMPTIKVKGLDLKVQLAPAVPRFLTTDRTKLHRILLNLLGNAIKFTEKGYITIEVLLLETLDNSARVQFSVADTGIGIPKNQQSKVFDRFHRVTPSYKGIYKGHGLGLHIVQSYVQLLGGKISLVSEENVGTRCTFILNLKFDAQKKSTYVSRWDIRKSASQATDMVSEKSPIQNQQFIANAPNLLLVDDNHISLKMLESFALKAGCRFTSTQSGENALQLAKTMEFDLIISDIGLPGISGQEFSRKFRDWEALHKKKPTPIIGLTAHAEIKTHQKCLDFGMNGVLSKPINMDTFSTILSRFFLKEKKQDIENSGFSGEQTISHHHDEFFRLEQYPLLDLEVALTNLGDKDILRKALHLMLSQEIDMDLMNLQKAYEQNNWDAIGKIAHKIKGSALYCGAVRLKYACQYLEHSQKSGNKPILNSLYQQLLHVVKVTCQQIENWLSNPAK